MVKVKTEISENYCIIWNKKNPGKKLPGLFH
jgi:hypothetical protein